jgi:PIN domain nuclease of toxin-antitoxin system
VVVLDASALLAYLHDEPGSGVVQSALEDGAAISALNLAEVLSKLVDSGVTADDAWPHLEALPLWIVDLDASAAVEIARLRGQTRQVGLSTADRACLALGLRLGATVLTADRLWGGLDTGVSIQLIR